MTETPTEVAARALGGQRVGGEWRAWCPVHEADRRGKPSLTAREGVDGLPVFQCESQGCSRDRSRFLAALAKVVPAETLRGGGTPPLGLDGEPDTAKLDNPLPSAERLTLWSRQLADRENGWDEDPDAAALRACLHDRYGADESIWRALGIGLWAHRHGEGVHQGVWLTVPVLSADGDLVNVREWNPLRAKGRRVRNWTGHGYPALLGAHKVGDWPADAPILLCEGEGDWLAATAAEWRAVTGTGGASNPPENLACLRGRTVVVVYDNDETGRTGAQKVAAELYAVGARVHIGTVGDYLPERGADVRDLLLHADLGPAELSELVDRALAADPWHADTAKRTDQLAQKMDARRLDREAKKLLDAEDALADWEVPPGALSLAEELELETEERVETVSELHWQGYNTLIIAAYKTGKTTLALNLIKALADGEDFLGRFPVTPPSGRVGWLNAELPRSTAVQWMRDLGVRNPDRVAAWHLTGHRLPLRTPVGMAAAVEWCQTRDVRTLVIDPFHALFDGEENSNDDVREWTNALDELKRRASVDDLFLVVHTGREKPGAGAEHARGATRLDDWAGARWVYGKNNTSPATRTLYAFGRDVDVERLPIGYNPATRTLRANQTKFTITAPGPTDDVRMVINTVLQIGRDSAGNGPGANEIRRTASISHPRVDAALALAPEQGRLQVTGRGVRGARHSYWPPAQDSDEVSPSEPQ